VELKQPFSVIKMAKLHTPNPFNKKAITGLTDFLKSIDDWQRNKITLGQ